jgi:hypothetical protein
MVEAGKREAGQGHGYLQWLFTGPRCLAKLG